jgi:hypothetical protein
MVPAAGVIVIGVAGDASPSPSLIENTCPVTPAGKFTATATGPGTSTLMTSSVAETTVTGVATAIRTGTNCGPDCAIVTVLAPVPVVGVIEIPAPASIDLGLFEYDIVYLPLFYSVSYTMFHSIPLYMNVKLPYGELITALAAPSMVDAIADTVIEFMLATPAASFTIKTVPIGLAGNTILAGITALAVTARS